MSERLFPVQDSTLSAEALAGWARESYNLSDRASCCFCRKGICDTYRVACENRAFYLKIYKHGRRCRMDVTEEVRLLNHLASSGISVAKPVARRNGAFVSEFTAPEGKRFAVLYKEAAGTHGDGGQPDRIRALGKEVARMHRCADTLPEPYQRAHLDMQQLIDDNLGVIEAFMAHRPTDLRAIQRIVANCRQRIPELLPCTKPEYGICHGDLHGGDVCYTDDQTPVLFDFDSSGCGWRALDIGVFLASDHWMDTSDEAERQRQRKLSLFLQGYSEERSPTDNELAAIQLTPPVRHIFLMGHVLQHTTMQRGNHWADDRFIDWHMAWFRHWMKRKQ